jgi:TatD DNase family protein
VAMEWVDIGLNLGHRSFERDRDELMGRALEAGVARALLTGTSVAESRLAVELARRYPGCRATAGVHPHDVLRCDDGTIAELEALLPLPEVVAVGECGLDFNRDFSPRPLQEDWFQRQLQLAAQYHMPLFLHERDAFPRFADILQEVLPQTPGAVVHCFTGSAEALRRYLDMGCYIGVTGWICDERRGGELQRLVSLVPSDRLLIETDAPYLVPRDLRPRPKKNRNEPAYLPHIGATIARLRGVSLAELARDTTENARVLFGV